MMVRGLLVASLMLLAACVSTSAPPEIASNNAIRIGSFNIAFIRDPEGLPKWEARRDAVAAVVEDMQADVLAFQEMETFAGGPFNPVNRQLDWVLENAPQYRVAATGEVSSFPSTQPILYRADRLALLEQGWFFFSETPGVIFSSGFDGGFSSYASTARFRDQRTGTAFTIINVHTDARSAKNRLGASELITERAEKLIEAGEPVIVLGDFNATRFSRTVRPLLDLGLTGTGLVLPTYHLGLGLGATPAVDHILVSREFGEARDIEVYRGRYEGSFPSDHYPIQATYDLAGGL